MVLKHVLAAGGTLWITSTSVWVSFLNGDVDVAQRTKSYCAAVLIAQKRKLIKVNLEPKVWVGEKNRKKSHFQSISLKWRGNAFHSAALTP